MGKIQSFAVFVCLLSITNAWGVPFFDDFDRPNGDVGNGWATQTDGTIEVKIVDNEVLISGQQGTDWVRSGISRDIVGETRVSCDFKANEGLNFHIRVDDADTSAYLEIYTWGGPLIHANSVDGGWPGWTDITGSNINAGEYNTVVLELVGTEFTVTLNGTVVATLANANFTNIGSVLIASDAAAGTVGSLHIDNVQIGVIIAGTAKDPSPANGATDVPRDVVLGWAAGEYAATHDVYFGTNLDDVNAADTTNPLGALVSPGQPGTSFDPDGLLDYGQTYYWRVDEVNAPPDAAVLTGGVWSFTVEPYTYPVTNITATASSTDKPEQGPENTINGSGLDADDLHSWNSDAMWVSSMTGAQPTWIQYEFDKPCRLVEMWVWNYNVEFEVVLGFGMRDVTVEYSLDGDEWTVLTDTEFARGPAANGYAHNTVVDFAGITAKYVRLTANTNWGGFMPQYGLSEVRFYHVPVQAREPDPASGASGVPLDVVLDWRDGREAASHDVYLSTDEGAVADGTALVDNVVASQYAPAILEFGQTYYWRIDEVNEAASPSVREGDVWDFATTEYQAIDDFESYTDDSPDRIFQTWIDGFGYTEPQDVPGNGTGSTVGNLQAPFAERSLVNSGSQAMPMEYDNSLAPFYSEAERTWDLPQDWTGNGADTLWVHFRGSPASFAETSPGYYSISSTSGDIWGTSDHFRYVYKELNGDGSIVAQIHSVSYAADWSKAGVMIRETLDADSSHAFMLLTPNGRRAMQNRPVRSNTSVSAHSATDAITFPFWVKIVRQGNQFTGYYSQNGVDWVQQPDDENTGADASPNPQTISMIGRVYVGMAVTSNNASASACVAEFSDVTTTGPVTGQWQVADIGGAIPGNDPDQLYMAVQDSAGRVAVVVHPDPEAVLLDQWVQWPILLSDLTTAGVNMTAVKKMYIGVGDRNNPQPAGTGKLYVDDIRFGRPLPPVEFDTTNILVNGGFEDGVLDPWTTYDNTGGGATAEVVQELVGATVPEGPIEGDSCLHVVVPTPGANFWDVGLSHAGHVFEAGKHYTLSVFLKCKEGTLDINLKPELGADPWTGFGSQVVTMTDQWVEYSVTTPVFDEDTSPGTITFHIGFATAELWIDGVRFYEGDYVPAD